MSGALDPALGAALRALAALPGVLVALDFDGVLAPIVDDAAAARALPGSAAAVAALAGAPGVHVALVSGRSLASLRAAAQPPAGVVLVASHGAEVEGTDVELDDAALALLATAVADVEAVVAAHPGTAAELKPAGVVLHTRRAAPDVAERAARAVLAGPAARPGVHAMTGKALVELAVVEVSKGEAVAGLRRRLDVDAVLFAGDDVTDETALRTLRRGHDVGVKVGPGESAAEHRVADPEAFAVVLGALADLRRSR